MITATRVAGQGLSPIRRMSLGAPPDAINLGLGEPGWAMPDLGAPAGPTPLAYGPNTSDPELVRAIGRYAGALAGGSTPSDTSAPVTAGHGQSPGLSPDQVMVTAGSQAALFALFSAYVEPGSVVLVPDPGFVAYPTLARMCGATPVGYPLGAGGDLDAEALADALGAHPHTSLVVLNHPANPTGGVASAAALEQVARRCDERDVLLVSDEVYAELWVDERPTSLREVTDNGVALGSMSKAFAAPGLRIGWATGDPDVLAPARLVHNAMTTAPSRLSQAAALALLESAEQVLPAAREEIRTRWETVDVIAPHLCRSARRIVGERHPATLPRTAGRVGFYLWLPLPHDVEEHGRSDAATTETFALRLRDEGGVTTIPGTAFGPRGAGFLRVSLGGPIAELEEGLRRLAPWWKA
ncbi:pyridoxal phosphate-dependent aminotransferase [Serinicoccus profundi]|uniref:pyridoxal phosphate-dependent aminotransferase n=1 Tax=Serinicoccus profundi TaxID=1078471 RepID=UPI000255F817|nr:pyridoxal phosphate-dependent aminotransferase [Serinicoccus profundi]